MKKIPLSPVPAQSLKVKLGGQNCQIRVYYRFGSTYMDLTAGGVVVVTGAICRDRQNVVQIAQNAFQGALLFVDMLGTSDPLYSGFGERWRLFYLTTDEYAARKPIEIESERLVLFLPFQDGTLVYNGAEQSPTWKNYNTSELSIGGNLSEINAGTYQAAAVPINGYKWWDGTISAKPVEWVIEKQSVTIPTVSSDLVYDGDEQTVSIDDYDPSLMTVTGTDSATDAGIYTLTFALIDTSNYQWEDGTTENKVVSWLIQKKNILTPTVVNITKTYDGTAQSPTILPYDTDAIVVSGDQSATNAGTYALFFSLTSTTNYEWSDGTTGLKIVHWYINPQAVEIPTVTDRNKTYNGAVQSPTVSAYDANIISALGDVSATNAGNYFFMLVLVNSNYIWEDGTTSTKYFYWDIAKATVAVPVLSDTTKTYDGTAQSPTISAYDSSVISATGDLSATDAGSYSITFSLIDIDNYQWTDETTDPQTETWSISPKVVAIPTMTNKAKTYTGAAQSPTISAFSSSEVTQTGTASATNAGTYAVNWNLTSTTNYQWTDGTTSQKSDTWTISAKSVTVPALSNTSKTYNGSSQSPTISTYSASELTVGGTTSATNAGTYTVTFTLTSTTNYKWSDNTTAAKSATWTIAKAAGSLSITPTSISLGSTSLTATISVTRAGDGAISAVSSDTSIATASVSGTTVTITAVATGSATITVSVAAGTNYLAPTNKTASVAVQLVFGFKNTGYQPFGQGIFIPH